MLSFWKKSRNPSAEKKSEARHNVVESLEDRKLMAAQLTVSNLDILPGPERVILQKIAKLDKKVPNRVHDHATIQLSNTGSATLTLTNVSFSGPFKLVGSLPSSIAPGKSANVTIQFVATAPPPFTYNQTAGTSTAKTSGAYVGGLTFKTNDPSHATYTEQLAGWYQGQSENEEEPSLQTLVNLLANYKTNLAPPQTVELTQGTTPKYFGEETVSAYWTKANPAKSVWVKSLNAAHSQGSEAVIAYFDKGTNAVHKIYTTDKRDGQAFLPALAGTSTPASGTFSSNGTFGFKVDFEWSADKKNKYIAYGGGHHIRFYPLRDHNGAIVANTYFLTMDYSIPRPGPRPPNYDFNDNVLVISNIKPAGN